MRKHDLSFLNKYIRKEDFFKNFFADLFEYQNFKDLDIPSKGGVYIFVSKEQKFIYPKGESRVIYIGESSNLRRRLYEHKSKYIIKDLNVPIVADADLGHINPSMPIITGSYAKVQVKNNNIEIAMELK